MNQLDPHTLFSIFEQGDEQIYQEYGMEDKLNNQYVLIGMVVKGLENYLIMDIMYTRHYGQDYKRIKSTIKYKYYNKLLGYLKRIDSSNFNEVYKIGESFDRQTVVASLDTLRVYFELLEEYEKCSIIKRYQDLVTNKTQEKVGYLI
jgi:hypothetical protein